MPKLKDPSSKGRASDLAKIPVVCTGCGHTMMMLPCEYRKKMKANTNNNIFHSRDCWKAWRRNKKVFHKQQTKAERGTSYKVRGDRSRGYMIAIPSIHGAAKEYTCVIRPGGILVYTPVITSVKDSLDK